MCGGKKFPTITTSFFHFFTTGLKQLEQVAQAPFCTLSGSPSSEISYSMCAQLRRQDNTSQVVNDLQHEQFDNSAMLKV